MGCRIIRGTRDGTCDDAAVLYDSVTETAFGPVFEDAYEAVDFMAWLQADTTKWVQHRNRWTYDPRVYPAPELANLVAAFRTERSRVTT